MISPQNVHNVIEMIRPITVDVKFSKIYNNSKKQQSHAKKKTNTNKIKGNTNYNINTLSTPPYNYTLLVNNK